MALEIAVGFTTFTQNRIQASDLKVRVILQLLLYFPEITSESWPPPQTCEDYLWLNTNAAEDSEKTFEHELQGLVQLDQFHRLTFPVVFVKDKLTTPLAHRLCSPPVLE